MGDRMRRGDFCYCAEIERGESCFLKDCIMHNEV